MCDIDELYDVGSDKEDEIDKINDELLIALVQANPLLYNKADKNFKNVEMKRDKWTATSVGCGASSGPAAERRWAGLRNMLGRKMREMKKGPSGAAGGKKPTVWPLLRPMSFLLPFIDNRRKRGSSVTHAGSRSNTQSPVLPLSPALSCEESKSSTPLWDTLSTIISPSTETDQDISSADNSTCSEPNSKRNEKKGRKSEAPPPDHFATKKTKKMDRIETVMQESSKSMALVAKALAAPDVDEKKGPVNEHPYMTAVKKAFSEVPQEKEMDCFMAIMNEISRYK